MRLHNLLGWDLVKNLKRLMGKREEEKDSVLFQRADLTPKPVDKCGLRDIE